MSFKVIDGGGSGREERPRRAELDQIEHEFLWAMREAVANLLRVIRGAGRPRDVLLQLTSVIDTGQKFYDLHGRWPTDVIAEDLSLRDEDRLKPPAIGFSQQDEEEWQRDCAQRAVCRGALQIVASGLLGQDLQRRAGRKELHNGIRILERIHGEQKGRTSEVLRKRRAVLRAKVRRPRALPSDEL